MDAYNVGTPKKSVGLSRDMISNTACGCGPPRKQDCGGSGAEWKVKAIAQPVREEQLGSRKNHIVRSNAENRPGVQVGAVDHIVLEVHGSLGKAGAARTVEPECRVILAGRGRLQLRRLAGDPVRKVMKTGLGSAGDHDVLQIPQPVSHRGHLVPQLPLHYERLGPAVVQEILIISRAHHGVDRDWNGSDLDGSEKTRHEFGRIVQEEKDAILHLNAQRAKRISGPVHHLGNLLIRERALPAAQRDPLSPPFRDMPVHELGGGVECIRNTDDGGVHAPGMLATLSAAVKTTTRTQRREEIQSIPGNILTTRGTPLELSDCAFIPTRVEERHAMV